MSCEEWLAYVLYIIFLGIYAQLSSATRKVDSVEEEAADREG